MREINTKSSKCFVFALAFVFLAMSTPAYAQYYDDDFYGPCDGCDNPSGMDSVAGATATATADCIARYGLDGCIGRVAKSVGRFFRRVGKALTKRKREREERRADKKFQKEADEVWDAVKDLKEDLEATQQESDEARGILEELEKLIEQNYKDIPLERDKGNELKGKIGEQWDDEKLAASEYLAEKILGNKTFRELLEETVDAVSSEASDGLTSNDDTSPLSEVDPRISSLGNDDKGYSFDSKNPIGSNAYQRINEARRYVESAQNALEDDKQSPYRVQKEQLLDRAKKSLRQADNYYDEGNDELAERYEELTYELADGVHNYEHSQHEPGVLDSDNPYYDSYQYNRNDIAVAHAVANSDFGAHGEAKRAWVHGADLVSDVSGSLLNSGDYEAGEEFLDISQGMADVINFGADFVPFVSTFKDFQTAITGKDWAGNDLTGWERGLNVVTGIVDLATAGLGGKAIKAGVKGGAWVAEKAIKGLSPYADDLLKAGSKHAKDAYGWIKDLGSKAGEFVRDGALSTFEKVGDFIDNNGKKLGHAWDDLDPNRKGDLYETIKEYSDEAKDFLANQSGQEVIDILDDLGEDVLKKFAELGTLWHPGKAAIQKVPSEWGLPIPNKKGVGVRYFDPVKKNQSSIRIDMGNPNNSQVLQQVDHVLINKGGKVLGPDGNPIPGAIADFPESHIPLGTWIDWENWYTP